MRGKRDKMIEKQKKERWDDSVCFALIQLVFFAFFVFFPFIFLISGISQVRFASIF